MRFGTVLFALIILLGGSASAVHAQFLDPGERSQVNGSAPHHSTGVWNRETTGITSAECGGAATDCNEAVFAGLLADLELCVLDPDWNPDEGGCLGPCRPLTRDELKAYFDGISTFDEAVAMLDFLLLFVCGDVEIEIDIYKAQGPNETPAQEGPESSTLGAVTVNMYDQYNFGQAEIRDAFRNGMGACAFSAGLGFVRYTDDNPEGIGHITTLTGAWNGYAHPSGSDPGFEMFDPGTGGHITGEVTSSNGHNYVNYGTVAGTGAPALWHLEELIVIRVTNCEDDCATLSYDCCYEEPVDADAEPDPPQNETGGGRDDDTEDGTNSDEGGDATGG